MKSFLSPKIEPKSPEILESWLGLSLDCWCVSKPQETMCNAPLGAESSPLNEVIFVAETEPKSPEFLQSWLGLSLGLAKTELEVSWG